MTIKLRIGVIKPIFMGDKSYFCEMEKNAKSKKVLNNNVVIAQNDNEETILMGLGLGFGKKAGEVVEDKKIEKIFKVRYNGPRRCGKPRENGGKSEKGFI